MYIKKDHINNNYIYSNIDNRKQNSILQLLYAFNNIKTIISISDLLISIIIFYYNKRQLILLNN